MVYYFFDTSALAKRYHEENGSLEVRRLFSLPDVRFVVSRLALVELESALAKKVRAKQMTPDGWAASRGQLFTHVSGGNIEIVALRDNHCALARELVARHGISRGLRTLDALQLASALTLRASGLLDIMVVADKDLGTVAAAEGLAVIDLSQGLP